MMRVLTDEEAKEYRDRLANFAAHRGFAVEFTPFLAQREWRSVILRRDDATVWTGSDMKEAESFINGWIACEEFEKRRASGA